MPKPTKYSKSHRERNTEQHLRLICAPKADQRGDYVHLFSGYRQSLFRVLSVQRHLGSQLQQKLLEEVADIQRNQKNYLQKEQVKLRKTLDKNAPLNLMIQSEKLNLYVRTGDSTLWKISDRWLGADLFESEGNICYFSSLPYLAPADTLYRTIADTLSLRLEQRFPQLHISSQSYEEDGKVFYTGCTF